MIQADHGPRRCDLQSLQCQVVISIKIVSNGGYPQVVGAAVGEARGLPLHSHVLFSSTSAIWSQTGIALRELLAVP